MRWMMVLALMGACGGDDSVDADGDPATCCDGHCTSADVSCAFVDNGFVMRCDGANVIVDDMNGMRCTVAGETVCDTSVRDPYVAYTCATTCDQQQSGRIVETPQQGNLDDATFQTMCTP